MARPERTDLRARHYLLSGDHSSPVGTEGHNKLESFGFWGRKFCIKNAEILSVGKIAVFAKFAGGKRRKSPDRFSLIRATASDKWKRISVLLACGGAKRKQNDNLLIPYVP